MKTKWPRLSETLPHCAPVVCGECGCTEENCHSDIQLWQEHDDSDLPEKIWFWLCEDCSKRIIEPHPRLYACVSDNTPAPGAMQICSDCPHRTRIRCPLTIYNGGPGVRVMAGEPTIFHIDRTVKGRRVGEWHKSYSVRPSGCSGKTPWPPPETPGNVS